MKRGWAARDVARPAFDSPSPSLPPLLFHTCMSATHPWEMAITTGLRGTPAAAQAAALGLWEKTGEEVRARFFVCFLRRLRQGVSLPGEHGG